MSKVTYIAIYHPKELSNVLDLLRIAKRTSSKLLIVPRTLEVSCSTINDEACIDVTLEELQRLLAKCTNIVLETNGLEILPIDLCNANCIAIVLGAEDYGIPGYVLERIPNRYLYRIPMGIPSASYNVVSSLVMLLTDLHFLCSSTLSQASNDSPYLRGTL